MRRTLYVGNLPPNIRERDVLHIFRECGRIAHIDLKTSPRHPSYAFVKFEEARDAENAINGHDKFAGYRLRVEFARGGHGSSAVDHYSVYKRGGGHGRVSRRSEYQVLVTGLPSSASWQDLKDHMRQVGDVCFSQVFRDASGKTGIVDYTSYEDMKYAITKLDKSKFQNACSSHRIIRVSEYKSSQSQRRSYSRSRSRSPFDSKGRSYSRRRSRKYSRSGSRGPSDSKGRSYSQTRSRRKYLRSRSHSPANSKGGSYNRSGSWRYNDGVLEAIEEIGWRKYLDENHWKADPSKDPVPVNFTVPQLNEFTDDFETVIEIGGFGNVYRGEMMGQAIVVKRSHPVDLNMTYISYLREVSLLPQIKRHKNIIELLGYKCDVEKQELFLVYPYYSNGSLRDALKKPDEVNELRWPQVIKIINGIAEGLEHLHSAIILAFLEEHDAEIPKYNYCKGLIHCDLKPENVLLDEHLEPVICDFGNSTATGNPHTGTFSYHDDATEKAEPRSDLHSLGIVILQLLMRRVDPQGLRAAAVEAKTKHLLLHHRLTDSNQIRIAGGKLITLALGCSDPNPSKRPDSVADFIVELKRIINDIGR